MIQVEIIIVLKQSDSFSDHLELYGSVEYCLLVH